MDRSEELARISDEIHEISQHMYDGLEGVGATSLDEALSILEDSLDGTFGYHTPPTPEEIERLRAECERNDELVDAANARIEELCRKYSEIKSAM